MVSSIKAPRRKKDENIEFTSFQLTLELRRVISEEEPGDEEAPDELVTALGSHLLLVEGDEDDGVLQLTAGLSESPGRLQHGYDTWETFSTLMEQFSKEYFDYRYSFLFHKVTQELT